MATVTRENIDLLHDKLTVTVTSADYTPHYKKSLRKYAETANIPGFRKGKVPESIINKMYGEKIITDEVLKTAEKEVKAYVENEQLSLFYNPLPVHSTFGRVDINNPKDYDFIFEIGLKPEININPNDIKVTRYVIDITEEMIDQEVERIQSQLGTNVDIETVSSDEDLLNVVFAETDADGNLIGGGLEKATTIKVKHFAPGFREKLLGLKVDSVVDAALNVAFEDKEILPVLEELGLDKEDEANHSKTFKVTITKIGILEKAPLDEKLFKDAYPSKEIKTEQEFRDVVKQEIGKYFAEESRRQMHDQIYHYLLDHTDVPLPKGFFLKLLEDGDEKRRTKEEALKIYPSFEHQTKWSLISTYLQKAENISIRQEDFKQLAKQHLFQYLGGQTQFFGDDDIFIEEYAEKALNDKKFIDDNYYNILADKIFTALEGKVTPTEESIDAKTFGSKLHHHHY